MALELEVDTLESVPAPLREYYLPRDGKFHLDVPIAGLKSALKKQTDDNREIKAALKEHGLSANDIPSLVNSNKSLIETRAKLRMVQCDSAVSLALMKAKAIGNTADMLAEHLTKRVTIETVEGRDVFRITKDGKPMVGSGSDGLANFDDLLKETIEKFPELFEGRGIGGGGATGKFSRGAGSKVLTRTQFEAIPPRDRAAKIREGFTVIDG